MAYGSSLVSFFFACEGQVFSVPSTEATDFHCVFFWLLCCKLIDHKCLGLFLALKFLLLIYVPVFMPIPCSPDYYSFVVQSEVREHDSTSIFLLSKIASDSQGLLWFHTNFRILFSISVKNVIGILIGIIFNLFIVLGSINTLLLLLSRFSRV